MKKTLFVYLRGGVKYCGAADGFLSKDDVQTLLLRRGVFCQRVLTVTHKYSTAN